MRMHLQLWQPANRKAACSLYKDVPLKLLTFELQPTRKKDMCYCTSLSNFLEAKSEHDQAGTSSYCRWEHSSYFNRYGCKWCKSLFRTHHTTLLPSTWQRPGLILFRQWRRRSSDLQPDHISNCQVGINKRLPYFQVEWWWMWLAFEICRTTTKMGLNQKCSRARARARALAGKAEITLLNYWAKARGTLVPAIRHKFWQGGQGKK